MIGIHSVYRHLPMKVVKACERALPILSGTVSELHIRLGSGSSLRSLSKSVYLGINVERDDVDFMLSSFTGGALYAYNDSIKEGYISLGEGVRVGVCGQARYEGERMVGICDVSSLLIRFPFFECAFVDKLCSAFMECTRGLIIFSPPSMGKTTALRALLLRLSYLRAGRISLIDERCEVDCEAFMSSDIDVFKGYERGEGLRTALRVMSPEIVAVDEIGSVRESYEVVESLLSGVKFIATAHAQSLDDLKKRPTLAPLFELKVFDVFSRIFNTDTGLECEIGNL